MGRDDGHFAQRPLLTTVTSAFQAAAFGAPAGIAVIFFAAGIPRVQQDILGPIPFIGKFMKKPEVHPADNVSPGRSLMGPWGQV
jgi:hypothetical protein